MPDGALNITLSDYTASKLAEKAKAMGIAPEELAAMVLDDKFVDYDDFIWINGDPRDDDVSNYDVNEPGRPWDEVRPEFMALIEKTFGPQE